MKKKIRLILGITILILVIFGLSILMLNKTFFSTKYIGRGEQEFFIPRYSYFKEECCMTAAVFYSLKLEQSLKKEIENYMKDFTYFTDESTYGYKKGDLFIQEYDVVNVGLYRKIIITY